MPEVSVIIPVYNSEKYVEKCICSVMAQTLPELEIIIINDGSIDESGKILRKLAQKDSRIILLEQENKGVAANTLHLWMETITCRKTILKKCTVLRKKKLLIW